MFSLIYRDHPDQPFEQHMQFTMLVGAGDYHFAVVDLKRGVELSFRFCINGGFERTHPKTLEAVANLYRSMSEECSVEAEETPCKK